MNNSKSRRISLGMLTALGLAGVVMSAPPARASPQEEPNVVSCLGSELATFTPGLKLEPQKVSTIIRQSLPLCVSSRDGSMISGSSVQYFTAEQACVDPNGASNTPGSETITWITGETSKFVYNKTYTQQAGQVVAIKTGSISEGKFRGAAAVMTLVAVSNTGECASLEGNTRNTASVQFVITIR